MQGDEVDKKILNPSKVLNLKKYFEKNWPKSSRNKLHFFNKHHKWLEVEEIPEDKLIRKRKAHRPKKDFSECLIRSKKNKKDFLMTSSSKKLFFALGRKIKSEGKTTAAKTISLVANSSTEDQEKLLLRITTDD